MIAGKGVPLLGEEGWLRHQEDAAKPPYEGADGVVSPGQRYNVNMYHNDHPVCAASEASRLFLTGAATPPVPGGEHPALQFIHTFGVVAHTKCFAGLSTPPAPGGEHLRLDSFP